MAEATKDQELYLREFFQEEFDGSAKTEKMTPAKRERVPRRKIHALIANMPLPESNPSDRQRIQGLLFKAYSGYVHGAYPHIMELFGGRPAKYHTSGMIGTPAIDSCEAQLVHYLYRALLSVELVAGRSGRPDIGARVIQLAIDLARQTECLSNDEIERMSRRLARLD